MSKLTESPSWKKLIQLQQSMDSFSLNQSFQENPERAEKFSRNTCGIFYDFSKQLLNEEVFSSLLKLAEQQDLNKKITALKHGEKVNTTEKRSALHHLLRNSNPKTIKPALNQQWQEVQQALERVKTLSESFHSGTMKGVTGKAFTDVIHIGIGGSDLGPKMVYQSLQVLHKDNIRCHFIANLSPYELEQVLKQVSPETTAVIVASKSFSTLETLTNAETTKQWLLESLPKQAIGKHFFALSANIEKAKNWGIEADNILPFWDWVGGRYSLWSAISLVLAIGLGFDNFKALLNGAEEMDEHFFNTPAKNNLPVIMALIGIWNRNFWNKPSLAVIPYDHRLRRFPAFLQQLEMESTGKSTSLDGEKVDYNTCPIIFGEAGANSQHSFFQQLHQGTDFTPIDFIAIVEKNHPLQNHQELMLANCLAQSRTLMVGRGASESELGEHKAIVGNKPSSTLLIEALTPKTLGALIALYEHKVYVQSCIWNINAFDQWGVELGKNICTEVHNAMTAGNTDKLDSSTANLIKLYQKS